MATHVYEARTDVPVEHLWPVVADIAAWPQSDPQIDSIAIDGPVQVGTPFVLKPKGGPRLTMVVESFDPPQRYVDFCRLPWGGMRTAHEFFPTDQGALIRVSIDMTGPLGGLWWTVVGRKHAQGLPAQTERFIARARQLQKT